LACAGIANVTACLALRHADAVGVDVTVSEPRAQSIAAAARAAAHRGSRRGDVQAEARVAAVRRRAWSFPIAAIPVIEVLSTIRPGPGDGGQPARRVA